MDSILWVAEIIIGINLIIFIHEFGHFIMAKKNGVKAEIFSLGMGPVLFRFRLKGDETEYRLSAIWLGGYVKLAGETPSQDKKPESYELWAKTPWQRFQIFIAGVVMNIIFAFPLCIVSFLIGKKEVNPTVAKIGIPEAYCGMQPGDKIIEVDGKKVQSLDQYRFEIVAKPKGSSVPVKVLRDGEEIQLYVEQMGGGYHRIAPLVNVIPYLKYDSIAYKAGLRQEDQILQIDNTKILSNLILTDFIKKNPGKEVVVSAIDKDNKPKQVKIKIPSAKIKAFPDDPHLLMPLIGIVEKGFPAYEIIEPKDHIISVDQDKVKSWADLREYLKGKAGKDIKVELMREGKVLRVKLKPALNEFNEGIIGVGYQPNNTFADVQGQSFYYKCGIRSGDILRQIENKVGNLSISDLMYHDMKEKNELKIKIERGGELINLALKLEEIEYVDIKELGLDALATNFINRKYDPVNAIIEGVKEPYKITILNFQLLHKLIIGEESIKWLSGPVGIAQVSYFTTQLGHGNFIWFLALITVGLAIINIIPLPLLDGGYVALLIYEVMIGRQPGEKTLIVFQYIGLVFVIALVVFVTYNDLNRLFYGW